MLGRAFQRVTDSGERVDTADGAEAVAALVASTLPDSPIVIDPDDGFREPLPELPASLRASAILALARVLRVGSENVNTGWVDSADADQWRQEVRQTSLEQPSSWHPHSSAIPSDTSGGSHAPATAEAASAAISRRGRVPYLSPQGNPPASTAHAAALGTGRSRREPQDSCRARSHGPRRWPHFVISSTRRPQSPSNRGERLPLRRRLRLDVTLVTDDRPDPGHESGPHGVLRLQQHG
ncbi:DUF4259 domain-containing protein [Streptomyces sp. DSM 40868]|uniref:DUF4259 domain-containing protein n=1 Tax=Streptomyces eurythermus TaxID=42237 RepID=UPI0012FF0072|nr:DUF4259 domain-containing protein [Streptomyces sp. DSM 40868]